MLNAVGRTASAARPVCDRLVPQQCELLAGRPRAWPGRHSTNRRGCAAISDGAVAIAADHDRRHRVGRRHGNGIGHLVVLALDRYPLAGPERFDHIQRFFQLLETTPWAGEVVVVGEIFILLPTGADPEDQLAPREELQGRGHVRQLPRIAVALAEHNRPDGQIGKTGRVYAPSGSSIPDRASRPAADDRRTRAPSHCDSRLAG